MTPCSVRASGEVTNRFTGRARGGEQSGVLRRPPPQKPMPQLSLPAQRLTESSAAGPAALRSLRAEPERADELEKASIVRRIQVQLAAPR